MPYNDFISYLSAFRSIPGPAVVLTRLCPARTEQEASAMENVHTPKGTDIEQYQALCQKEYPGCAMFARDVNLAPGLAEKYKAGSIIREKAFTDASIRFMGMVTTHRYVILSNHMADLSAFEHGTNWGLHVAGKDSHFKVLGVHSCGDKTGIFLLHLPDDESWKVWQTVIFDLDETLYRTAVERFDAKCSAPPVPELTTPQWLDRCTFPLGMDNAGNFWPLEDAAGQSSPAPAPVPDVPSAPYGPFHSLQQRYRGCLLGGAVGDALGYPVEFIKENTIWNNYGPEGIRTLEQAGTPAVISDDTQMTLFAANAILYSRGQKLPLNHALWLAYREWLGTQGDTSRMESPSNPKMWVFRDPRLHACRAPGNTCLNAIFHSPNGGTTMRPINNSKGCGTVMRAAPFGLAVPASAGDSGLRTVYELAAADAALTHGHCLAWASSGALAQILYEIVQHRPQRDYPLQEAVSAVCCSDSDELKPLLDKAVRLAEDSSIADLDAIHMLGEGWVAEEALAIAVFCAVRHQNDFAAAIRAAVNHKGDSDSTGAVCGNILGAWLGEDAVAQAFDLDHLELRDTIEKMADRLFTAVNGPFLRRHGVPFLDCPEGGTEQDHLLWKKMHRQLLDSGFPGHLTAEEVVPAVLAQFEQLTGHPLRREDAASGSDAPAGSPDFSGVWWTDHLLPSLCRWMAEADQLPCDTSVLLDGLVWQLPAAFARALRPVSGAEGAPTDAPAAPESAPPPAEDSLPVAREADVPAVPGPEPSPESDTPAADAPSEAGPAPAEEEVSTSIPAEAETVETPVTETSAADVPSPDDTMSEETGSAPEPEAAPVPEETSLPAPQPAMPVEDIPAKADAPAETDTQQDAAPVPEADAGPDAAPVPGAETVQGVPEPSVCHEPPEDTVSPEVPHFPAMAPLRPVGLMYTPLTKKALAICFDAHKNQCDKGGLPYVFHPFHLAEQMETELEVCTALLHDVVEDSHYTFEDLQREGFPQPVLEALRLMTRDPYMHYLDYVVQLRKNPIARRVKLADLRHNSDLDRLVAVGPKDKRRLLRYRMALAILADDAYDVRRRCFCKRLPLSVEQPFFLSVYYDTAGKVLYYCVSEETAASSRCWFDGETGEKLRLALNPHRTLPDNLADLTPLSCQNLDGLLRHYGIDPTLDPAD